MNEISRVILDHRSIRNYKSDIIDPNHIEVILRGAMQAPSSVNGQSVTVIEINDQSLKKEIIEIASNQTWIQPASHFYIFCIDYHKAIIASKIENTENVFVNQTEAVMVGSLDVGLAMGNAIAIAESLGYGTVPIGAIRNNPGRIIELLKLPKYVYPIAGLVIGFRNEESEKKPRMDLSLFSHKNAYNEEIQPHIEKYNQVMSSYMKKRTKGESERTWSETTAKAYSTVKHPYVTETLKAQGFLLK